MTITKCRRSRKENVTIHVSVTIFIDAELNGFPLWKIDDYIHLLWDTWHLCKITQLDRLSTSEGPRDTARQWRPSPMNSNWTKACRSLLLPLTLSSASLVRPCQWRELYFLPLITTWARKVRDERKIKVRACTARSELCFPQRPAEETAAHKTPRYSLWLSIVKLRFVVKRWRNEASCTLGRLSIEELKAVRVRRKIYLSFSLS